ncbi:hypothetical protein BH24ACT5_BH24ACT5_26520 [soil metagenome]
MTSLHDSSANGPFEVDIVESGPGRPFLLTDAQALTLSASRLVRVEPSGTPGQWVVSGAGKVGVLRVGDVTLRMRPKLAIERIFFLMGYSPKFRWRDDLVGYDTAPDLVRVLAESFVHQAERALGHGGLQGDVTRDEELSVVRGRLESASR